MLISALTHIDQTHIITIALRRARTNRRRFFIGHRPAERPVSYSAAFWYTLRLLQIVLTSQYHLGCAAQHPVLSTTYRDIAVFQKVRPEPAPPKAANLRVRFAFPVPNMRLIDDIMVDGGRHLGEKCPHHNSPLGWLWDGIRSN
jgi:hypothetical protein